MARPRKIADQGLPRRVYLKHGAYYYVHSSPAVRWERLGTDLARAKDLAEQYNAGAPTMNTLGHWLDAWVREELKARVKAGTLAQRTYDDYEQDIEPVKDFIGHMAPTSIQAKHISEYLKLGREMDRPVRANREKAALSSCLSWMTAHGHAGLEKNVAKLVKRNTETPRARFISDAEYRAAMAKAGPAEAAWGELMYRTLQRPSDILRWKHTDIQDADGKRVLVFTQSKTKARLRIQVTTTLQTCIDQLARTRKKASPYLIPREDGRAYTESGISSMFRRAVVKAGLEDFAAYDLKAKGATDMYQAGVPISTIQGLCGHDSVTTTEVYIKQHLSQVVQPNDRELKAA